MCNDFFAGNFYIVFITLQESSINIPYVTGLKSLHSQEIVEMMTQAHGNIFAWTERYIRI